ncbi:aldehyde dehydrogenase family protein [Pseudarthrobacter sp. Y6]|uniref:aldehyde dehydrogenase family protein n=1 Tax=Pseudarthrobacter sp. Y6 TaxID=3418422 RepID=UPI003CFA86EF
MIHLSGKPRDIVCAYTGETMSTVNDASAQDVDDAIQQSALVYRKHWSGTSADERASLLRALAAKVRENADELARLETSNTGKAIRESSQMDVPGTAACLDYYSTWTDKLYGEVIPHSGEQILNYTLKESVGVVGAIVPWNGPLSIGTWKIGPAVAAGNTIVIKPPELAPLSLLKLGELALEAGFPPGVITVLPGDREVGTLMVQDPRIAALTFTGSTPVGQQIMRTAAGTLKRLTLECGGKSANIIFADADMDKAIESVLFGIFMNQGQVCASGSRLLVQREVREEFVNRLIDRAARIRVGDPMDPDTEVGSLISPEHLAKVDACVQRGIEEGAELVAGGSRRRIEGLADTFYEPTILTSVSNQSRLGKEEVFGPVLAVMDFDHADDAVEIANDSIYGLVGNIHTTDLWTAHSVASRLQVGSVFVNQAAVPYARAPFGGRKQTGFGKDLGRQALDAVTFDKSVVINMTPQNEHFRWYAQ